MHTSTVGTLCIVNNVTNSFGLGVTIVVNLFLRNDIRRVTTSGINSHMTLYAKYLSSVTLDSSVTRAQT